MLILVIDVPEMADVIITNTRVTLDAEAWRVTNDFILEGTSILVHPEGESNGVHLIVGETLSIAAAAKIDASFLGSTSHTGTTGFSGGSYGGRGRRFFGEAISSFGSYLAPLDLGSGGAQDHRGGGLIRIQANLLQLDGSLLANGQDGTGGGSGGSVWVDVDTLTGTGAMQVTVEPQAVVDADERGNGPSQEVTGRSGGSYGGSGEAVLGTTNPTHGSKEAPDDLGTGGAGGSGTKGGGAIRVIAPDLVLEGQLVANGQHGLFQVGGARRRFGLVGCEHVKRFRPDPGAWRK